VIEVSESNSDEIITWDWNRAGRLHYWYARFDVSDEWVVRQVERNLAGPKDGTLTTFNVLEDGEDVGYLVLAEEPQLQATIYDLWVVPEHRRRGVGTAMRKWAEDWAKSRAKSLFVNIDPRDRGLRALFASYPTRARTMMKRLAKPASLPGGVEGRPMTEARFETWVNASTQVYADEIFASGSMSREDAMARAVRSTEELLPDGVHTAGHTFWSVFHGEAEVGTNWLRHHHDPNVSFVYAVESHEAFRGKGYGRAAMIVGEHASRAAGDTHIGLNVFGHNAAAIALYKRLGYRPIDDYRSIDL